MKRFVPLAIVLLTTGLAGADDKHDHGPHGNGAGAASAEAHGHGPGAGAASAEAHGHGPGAGSAPPPGASAAPGAAKHDDDDDGDDAPAVDGGKPVAGRLTPAQLGFRKETWEKREKAVEARVQKGGKKMTAAEREAIQKHWLNVGRLLRIRELAQADKDEATVKRVDLLLAKAGKGLENRLEGADGGAK